MDTLCRTYTLGWEHAHDIAAAVDNITVATPERSIITVAVAIAVTIAIAADPTFSALPRFPPVMKFLHSHKTAGGCGQTQDIYLLPYTQLIPTVHRERNTRSGRRLISRLAAGGFQLGTAPLTESGQVSEDPSRFPRRHDIVVDMRALGSLLGYVGGWLYPGLGSSRL
jgi:hypothetical protein